MTVEFALSIDIDAPTTRVWDEITNIATQTEWMEDAVAIRFTSSMTRGEGTSFECDTRVLFFTTTDNMLISDWNEGNSYTVNHQGAFSGAGTFSLTPRGESKCTFTWDEKLTFPWFFAGPLGEQVAKPILSHLWRTDLESLKARCESEPGMNPLAFFSEMGEGVKTQRKKHEWIVSIGDRANFATGSTAYGARQAALQRWLLEHN